MGDRMEQTIKDAYEKAVQKRNELRERLQKLEAEEQKDSYNIMITRDRLAYWEGKTEGLQFALDQYKEQNKS
jgi:hypothetical protein